MLLDCHFLRLFLWIAISHDHIHHVVQTCAAIYLAATDLKLTLPMKPEPWWERFLGTEGSTKRDGGVKIATVANAILGLMEYERTSPTVMMGFLPSLIPGGSFNDPDSFLWESRKS
jgi:hypothetical protein